MLCGIRVGGYGKGGSGLFITVIKHKKWRALSSQTNAAVVGW